MQPLTPSHTMHASHRRARRWLLLMVLLLPATVAHAQHGGKDKNADMEQFDELCPYTKGERALEKSLGYARFGFIPWRHSADSSAVQENMGGIPMLWVETEHFRIGSSLGTYKIGNDREERERIKGEVARLKKKVGKLRAPKKSVDPYLRLHVYAQRAEDVYSAFLDDFQIDQAAFSETRPHLGHKNKILLLLCQRKSEYGRYLRTYEKADAPFSYRMGHHDDGLIVVVNMESVKEFYEEDDLPFDTMLHCLVANSLASTFVDGFEQNMFKAPTWVVYGLAHIYSKRVDPHYPFFDARRASSINYVDLWDWVPRVENLVKNSYYPSAEEMFLWKKYDDLNSRDHLIAWSKLEYLLTTAKGDHRKFLSMICRPLSLSERKGNTDVDESVVRQTRALAAAYSLTPAELDAAWSTWVTKTYKKR